MGGGRRAAKAGGYSSAESVLCSRSAVFRSVQRRVERAQREESRAIERGEHALARRFEEEGVQGVRGGETQAEAAAERRVDRVERGGPRRLVPRVGEQRIEGEL